GVHLSLNSPDFISSFTVDDLDMRHFAAPDLPSRVTFFADRVGRHELRGDELCGRPHTERARGWLVVDTPADFQRWVRTRRERGGEKEEKESRAGRGGRGGVWG